MCHMTHIYATSLLGRSHPPKFDGFLDFFCCIYNYCTHARTQSHQQQTSDHHDGAYQLHFWRFEIYKRGRPPPKCNQSHPISAHHFFRFFFFLLDFFSLIVAFGCVVSYTFCIHGRLNANNRPACGSVCLAKGKKKSTKHTTATTA